MPLQLEKEASTYRNYKEKPYIQHNIRAGMPTCEEEKMEHGRSGFSDETFFRGTDADTVRRKKWSTDAQVFPTKRLLEARMPTL